MSMTMGAVARAAGVGVETIRYYERSGLLEPPPRSPAGYRCYPPETVDQIAAYKRLQRLGFTLGEAAELLALHNEPEPCEAVKQRAAAVVISLVLAAALWFWATSAVLIVAAMFALLFAALDLREVAHQLGEARSGLAAIALLAAVLHVGVTVLAGLALTRRDASVGTQSSA